ncbi:MAG: hypothetical protein ABIG95_01070 [Candidatus Woesearchaeota archaeon]
MTDWLCEVFANNPFVMVAEHNDRMAQLKDERLRLEIRLEILKKWLNLESYYADAARLSSGREGIYVSLKARCDLETITEMLGKTAVDTAFTGQFDAFTAEIQEPESPYHINAGQIEKLQELVGDPEKNTVDNYPLAYLRALFNALSPKWESESSRLKERQPGIRQELDQLWEPRYVTPRQASDYIKSIQQASMGFAGAALLGIRFIRVDDRTIPAPYLVIPHAGPEKVSDDFFTAVPILAQNSGLEFGLQMGENAVTVASGGKSGTIGFCEYRDTIHSNATEVVLPGKDSPLAEMCYDLVEMFIGSLDPLR